MSARPYYGAGGYSREQDASRDDGDSRKRKVGTRRTVDYGCTNAKWLLERLCQRSSCDEKPMRPGLNEVINMLPTKAYLKNPATSVAVKYVHTSTNKIKHPVNVVKWTPEGRRLLTGSSSGEFTLWNGMMFNFETILQAHDDAVRCLKWSDNGDWLLSGDTTGIVKYWQPNMNNVKVLYAHRDSAVRDLAYRPQNGVINGRFSPNDTKFVSAGDDNLIKIWNFNEGVEERVLTGHGWEVRSVDWHPTKGLLASGSKDNLVKLWDPRTSRCLSTLHFHKQTVGMVRFQPGSGNFLATASRDATCRILDLRAMKDFKILRGHEKDVTSVSWHPIHTSLIVTGGYDGSINHYILDDITPPTPQNQTNESSMITMQPTATVAFAHESAVWSLDWHPQGHLLCSGSNDRATRFWERPRPGDPMFMKDRYHLGQDQADALGYTRRSAAAQRREEEEALEDESNALIDQQMPLPDQHAQSVEIPGMNVPGLTVPGLTTNGFGGGMPTLPPGLDLSSLPGLLQSFGGGGGGGMFPGLGGSIPGMNKGPPLPMQTDAFRAERDRSHDRDRSRDRSPDRWDRDRNWRDGGRRERNGYGRR